MYLRDPMSLLPPRIDFLLPDATGTQFPPPPPRIYIAHIYADTLSRSLSLSLALSRSFSLFLALSRPLSLTAPQVLRK